ncbi:MAG: nickel-dependent lactate racemase [Bacteroidetes bacterium]|nr:nickel-dependent lactate racemase [Bacteroidota bacterium]
MGSITTNPHARNPSDIQLDYGSQGLSLNLDGFNATVLRPRYLRGLPDEHETFIESVRNPYNSPPLRKLVSPDETVAVVIPDITRALPSDRLLPWLFEELSELQPENVTIIVGTGAHRGNTHEELLRMVGPQIVAKYRIVNHDARNSSSLIRAGRSQYGYDVFYTAEYVNADRRILMGFIEPHFMAGFSGGYKAVFPGIADLNAIQTYHGFANIAHPKSTWGILEENPTQNHVRSAGRLLPIDFLVNVTLNTDRQITGYFCGDITAAHEAGCAFSKDTAMVKVEREFPIVVTTNSGYPLDLNLYQSVKGMSAAHSITARDGLIITAARCNDGFPEHGAFKNQVLRWASPDQAWSAIRDPDFREPDQWQTQKLLQILQHCRIHLFSELDPALVQKAHLTPIDNVRDAIKAELIRLKNPETPIAILPEGPLTIPYVD